MVRRFDRVRDLAQARRAPGAVFAGPEAVVGEPQLTLAEKIEILRRWSYDAGEPAFAEADETQGGEPSLTDRILTCLDHLESAEEVPRSAAVPARGRR